MSNLLNRKKVDLTHLKAAIVLAFHSTSDNPIAKWWSGVVNGPMDQNGNTEQYIVFQVPKEGGTYARDALTVLKGYGIKDVKPVAGSSYTLLPINVDHLENCLPSRVTRQWLMDDEHDGTHDEWKRSVVVELDALGVGYLEMHYSGSGDSSNNDEWSCSRTCEEGSWYPESWNDDVQKHWSKQSNFELSDQLQKLISEYVWETLVQYDCVNNDGGGGSLKIDLSQDEPVFHFECFTNEMIQTTHDDDEI